jgi:hypothetical protein
MLVGDVVLASNLVGGEALRLGVVPWGAVLPGERVFVEAVGDVKTGASGMLVAVVKVREAENPLVPAPFCALTCQ